MSNSALNESKYRVELIKLSHPTSSFLFELNARKRASTRQQSFCEGALLSAITTRLKDLRFKMVRYHFREIASRKLMTRHFIAPDRLL